MYRIGLRLRPDEEKDLTDSIADLYNQSSSSRHSRADANIPYEDFVAALAGELRAAEGSDEIADRFKRQMQLVRNDLGKSMEEVCPLSSLRCYNIPV